MKKSVVIPSPDLQKRPMFYLVQREGVYGRGIVGVFSTEAKAKEAALNAAREESDFYHKFTCYEVQSDMRVTLAYEIGEPGEPGIFVVKRGMFDGLPAWIVERPPAP